MGAWGGGFLSTPEGQANFRVDEAPDSVQDCWAAKSPGGTPASYPGTRPGNGKQRKWSWVPAPIQHQTALALALSIRTEKVPQCPRTAPTSPWEITLRLRTGEVGSEKKLWRKVISSPASFTRWSRSSRVCEKGQAEAGTRQLRVWGARKRKSTE